MTQARQDYRNTPLSAVTRFEQNGQLLQFETAEARVVVQLYSASLVRIRALALHRSFEDHSYAVISRPETVSFRLTENETGWSLHTDKMQLRIQRAALRFDLYDAGGHLLLGDDAAFGISFLGNEISCYKSLRDDEKFIGLGEKTGFLNRRGKWYQHWNTDAFAYGEEEDPLYLSTPFYMGITAQRVYGVFLDNSYRSVFNFGASNHRFSYFQVPDGELDYYMFCSGSVAETISEYSWLTGRMPMPPKWSLGYQQCRYSYYPDKEVLNIARTFREKHIPCDVIYLDIHFMDQYKLFTWNNREFPDPAAFIRQLREMGFQVVVIVDPGVKDEEGYRIFEELRDQQLFVAYPDGTPYKGDVWPGTCLFPDFTREATRNWWGKQFEENIGLGIEGYWNDMNEPVTWGKKLPDLLEFDFDGFGASHRKAHNVYGMQMARSTFEGVKARLNGRRPFVLTRAGFSGIQRYAAVWTGDNSAGDDHMLMGVRLLSSMGLTGIPFTGMDVGGFVGESSPRLFTRWMQIGAFSPMFRGHTMINSRDSEPWSYGEEAEEISRNFIRLRYRLMPYIYSVIAEAVRNGQPLVRSLAIDYTHDENIYNRDWSNQYMFGPSLLVAAVNSWQPIQKVYLPEGEWYSLYNDALHAGKQVLLTETPAEILPVFVKAGTVIPVLEKSPENLQQAAADTLCLHLYAGSSVESFVLYEDSGHDHAFEDGFFTQRELIHTGHEKRLTLEEVTGKGAHPWTKIRVYFHGLQPDGVKMNGVTLPVSNNAHRFIEPISNFDPFFVVTDFPHEHKNLASVEFDWKNEKIELSY